MIDTQNLTFVRLQNNRDKRNILKASKVREKSSSPQMKDQNENDIVLLKSSTRCYKSNE